MEPTPKGKAKELVKRFESILPSEGETDGNSPIECALIAVDEILGQIVLSSPNGKYWVEVKIELEKL